MRSDGTRCQRTERRQRLFLTATDHWCSPATRRYSWRSSHMNIYQMRHVILAKHLGERISPAQLKVELLKKFPSVKFQSVNASDCHYSDRKKAGSTCPECGKVGGFAVNRNGVVDMGASGWGGISPFYTPTGNTRSTVGY